MTCKRNFKDMRNPSYNMHNGEYYHINDTNN